MSNKIKYQILSFNLYSLHVVNNPDPITINEPIIITPNFDNYNDEWIPILDLDVDIEVNILNRWGQKEYVYIGNSLSFVWDGIGNWGGTHDLPSGDYYYIIKFNNNNYTDKTGVITLIR